VRFFREEGKRFVRFNFGTLSFSFFLFAFSEKVFGFQPLPKEQLCSAQFAF